jgi:hypothetical protein
VAKKKDSIDKQEMAANYGWSLAFLKSNKELWKLFNKAVDKNYSVNRFVAELRNTKWFQKHSDAWRQQAVLQKTDPSTYKKNYAAMRNKVHDMAGQVGADLTSKILDTIAHNALWFGWDDGMLKNALANYIDQMGQSGHYGGDAGQAESELRDYAYKMGLKLNDGSVKSWLQEIVRGDQSLQDYRAWLQGEAQKSFPALADKIKSGQTVYDLASPYMQSMSQILEVPQGSVDLFDPTIRKALQVQLPDGKVGMDPIYDFERKLRQDPRWLSTNNARQSLMGTTKQILQDFGFQS